MAERFPRYRPLGIGVASMPRIDYASAGAAEARGLERMSSALSKMSQFAFEEAGKRAKREGLEYGAQNAPTQQQIKDSIESGEPLQQIGDDFTVFGQAARAAALSAVSNEVEVLGRKAIADLQLATREGRLTPDQFTTEVNASIDGYASVLSDFSQAEARKMRATLATLGNTVFVSASKEYNTLLKKQRAVKIINLQDQIINSIPTVIDSGDKRGQDGSIVTYNQILESNKLKMLDIYTAQGDPDGFKAFTQKFNEAILNYKKNEFSNWAKDPDTPDQEIFEVLLEGKFKSGSKLKRLFDDTTNPEDKQQLIDTISKANKSAVDLEESRQGQDLESLKRFKQNQEQSFVIQFIANPQSIEDSSLDYQLKTQKISETFHKMAQKEKTRVGDVETNPNVYREISGKIVDGINQHDDIIRARLNDQLNSVQTSSLLRYNAEMLLEDPQVRPKQVKQARDYLISQIAPPVGMIITGLNESAASQLSRRRGAALIDFDRRVAAGEDAKLVADELAISYKNSFPKPPSLPNQYEPKNMADVVKLNNDFENFVKQKVLSRSDLQEYQRILRQWAQYFNQTMD